MNRERRKQINENKKIVDMMLALMDHLTLENVKDDEQEAFDNMPEGLQMSDRGSDMEQNVEALDEIINKLDEIQDMLIDIQVDLEEFIE